MISRHDLKFHTVVGSAVTSAAVRPFESGNPSLFVVSTLKMEAELFCDSLMPCLNSTGRYTQEDSTFQILFILNTEEVKTFIYFQRAPPPPLPPF
jgi:hypothetical protein